jgi:thymidylate synthase (FAD)
MKISCLDKGWTHYLSHGGDDLLVVNAARASFSNHHDVFNSKRDVGLINYLAKNKHLLPFRHPSVTLRLKVPIFVLRQLGKHQVGMSMSEVSRRYITQKPTFYTPETWRSKPKDSIKQGSGDGLIPEKDIEYKSFCNSCIDQYNNLLKMDVAPEMARMVLPQSMYTTIVWTGTLLAWFHLYKLRIDSHTQLETREYAEAISNILFSLFPESWGALCEHLL